jgi:hypothetical protein
MQGWGRYCEQREQRVALRGVAYPDYVGESTVAQRGRVSARACLTLGRSGSERLGWLDDSLWLSGTRNKEATP